MKNYPNRGKIFFSFGQQQAEQNYVTMIEIQLLLLNEKVVYRKTKEEIQK